LSAKVHFGKVPDKDFASGPERFSGTKVGVITRVDEVTKKADVRIITGADERFEVDISQSVAGPRSFLGGIPEEGSLVVVAYRRRSHQIYEAVILGFLAMGNVSGQRFDPFAQVPPGEIDPEDASDVAKVFGKVKRYKSISGNQGDLFGMSASGAEWSLTKDVRLVNRAGDLFELRDVDRTLLSQSIYRSESDGASLLTSGPARRGGLFIPLDVLDGRKVKGEGKRYYGSDDLTRAGFLNGSTLLDHVNDDTTTPPVTYGDGRQTSIASRNFATNPEDFLNGGSGRGFTERRLEIRHESDFTQEVLEDIDGFAVDRPRAYIEHVLGTLVGNDAFSTMGQRQYAKVLKPKIFEDFDQSVPGTFALEECHRPPAVGVDEALTMAGAILLKMLPPRSDSKEPFAMGVSKQGKVFLNVPGSSNENYSEKNVSVEANLGGALKAFIGASNPQRISVHLTLEGGIYLDIGPNSEGECITTNYRGAVKNTFKGNSNSTDDVAHSTDVQGNTERAVSGNDVHVIRGFHQTTVDGGYQVGASSVKMNGLNGFTGNFGGWSSTISGKTQNQYAQLVLETIATGGKLSTILAGGLVQNIAAGAMTYNVLAGATLFNNPAGAFTVTVGTGAISITTGAGAIALSTAAGALSLGAAGGAIAITAGLGINLAATTLISLLAPQVLLGGPPAVLGVVRGVPALPPGTPTLDYITGLPLLGSAIIRSL